MAKKKVGKKVSCAVCEAQYNRFCTTKRVTVVLNKKRLCDKFIYDESKIKKGVPVPTTRITFKEKEMSKNEHKEELKELKNRIEEKTKADGQMTISTVFNPHTTNSKHPTTGDLSRFTTTGSKDEANEDNQ